MSQPYDGIRIIDLTHDLGRYATRLFANLGATVIRVEPLDGAADRKAASAGIDPGARYEFEFFNAGKSALALDVEAPDAEEHFLEIARGTDGIVLERGGPFFDRVPELHEALPGAVIASVSPYGRTGPLAKAPASDLVLQAAGGIAWLSGRPEDEPLSLPGSQATMVTGVYLAAAMSVALLDAEATGRGHVIDVSAQEAIAHSLQNSIQVYDFEKRVSMRGGEGTRDASENVFACKDGYIFLAAPRTLGVSWDGLMGWISETGHLAGEEFKKERWADRKWRLTREAKDLFRVTIEPFFSRFTKDEITRQGMARRIVLGPVATLGDVLNDPQLKHTDYFLQQSAGPFLDGTLTFPGAPFRFSHDVWRMAPAPALSARAS